MQTAEEAWNVKVLLPREWWCYSAQLLGLLLPRVPSLGQTPAGAFSLSAALHSSVPLSLSRAP